MEPSSKVPVLIPQVPYEMGVVGRAMDQAQSGSHPSVINGPDKIISPLGASFSSPQLVVLNEEQFRPPGNIQGHCLETFFNGYWHLVGRAQGCC